MSARVRWNVIALTGVLMVHAAVAQEEQAELTPAGRAALQSTFAANGRSSRTVLRAHVRTDPQRPLQIAPSSHGAP
jgi:hypothetical protein